MTWQNEAAQRYGTILAGLMIGTAARYSLALGDGQPITLRAVLVDVLQLAFLALGGAIASDHLGLHGDTRAFFAAVAALSSDRLIKLVRTRFMAEAERRLGPVDKVTEAADFARVPAGSGSPATLRAEFVDGSNPVGSSLKRAYRGPLGKRPPADQIELLRQLPTEDDPPQE